MTTNILCNALDDIYQEHTGDDNDLRISIIACFREVMTKKHHIAYEKLQKNKYRGIKCAESISESMDNIIVSLSLFICKHLIKMTDAEMPVILAVGGYGRGKLAPYSDVDLIFIVPRISQKNTDYFIEYILYILWDMGLKLGHAVHSVANSLLQAKIDMITRTSLLDARFLYGNDVLYQEYKTKFTRKFMQKSAHAFIKEKLRERHHRHMRQGQSRYLVEPNVKEGKGGIRDLDTLFWIAKYCYAIKDIRHLLDKGFLTKKELNYFIKCENFLWSVRCFLHFHTKRAEECLSFDVQIPLAEIMGFQEKNSLNKVEIFMRKYFLIAKDVGNLTRIFCAKLEEQHRTQNKLRYLPALFRKKETVYGFIISGKRLGMAHADVFQKDPINLIRVFQLANDYNLLIHPEILHEITSVLHLIDDQLRENIEANHLFLSLLMSKKHPERILRHMNEAGVLGKFIPDFGRIVALMQFNMYHHYTADEHLLRAIGILSSLEQGQDKDKFPITYKLLGNNINRKVIYLAVFLHDIAKGRHEDHSLAGARIARSLGKRFGLTDTEIELTEWLVRYHLLMSDTAQKRDLSDKKTIINFIETVQTIDALRHLFVLTVVDISAVGPHVWNSWKGWLLSELYYEAEAALIGSASHFSRTQRVQKATQNFIIAHEKHNPNWSSKEREKYIKRHYDAYWLSEDLNMQLHCADVLSPKVTQDIILESLPDDASGTRKFLFACPDYLGLLSHVVGACYFLDMDVVEVSVLSTCDGIAFDILRIKNNDASMLLNKTVLQRLRHVITKVIKGEIAPYKKDINVQEKKRLATFEMYPTVLLDNDISSHATVLEVSGINRLGILYALTRGLFDLNLVITSARVVTIGERCIDVFYVQDIKGHKILQPSQLNRIKEKMLGILEYE